MSRLREALELINEFTSRLYRHHFNATLKNDRLIVSRECDNLEFIVYEKDCELCVDDLVNFYRLYDLYLISPRLFARLPYRFRYRLVPQIIKIVTACELDCGYNFALLLSEIVHRFNPRLKIPVRFHRTLSGVYPITLIVIVRKGRLLPYKVIEDLVKRYREKKDVSALIIYFLDWEHKVVTVHGSLSSPSKIVYGTVTFSPRVLLLLD